MKTWKNILWIFFVFVLATASFAQPEEFTQAEFESGGYNDNLGFGFYGTVPTVKYGFTSDLSGQIGMSVSKVSVSGQSDATTTFLLQGDNVFLRLGDVNLKFGGFLSVLHDPSNSAILAGTIGVEKRISPNLNLGFDIIPVSLSSAGRGSSTIFGILSGTVISAHFYF